jgi:hypothetical protein
LEEVDLVVDDRDEELRYAGPPGEDRAIVILRIEWGGAVI